MPRALVWELGGGMPPGRDWLRARLSAVRPAGTEGGVNGARRPGSYVLAPSNDPVRER